nr:carboxypeptidase M32 [Rhodospirillales bacterium]
WGYFPSYSLGAMAAAQFFDAAVQSNSDILPSISLGNFGPLYDWLTKNIHSRGSLYETPELIKLATGKQLDPSIFKRHLTQRYLT